MLDQRRRLLAAFTIATSALAILGCPKSVQRQLDRPSKDRSAMVRASQIIPVYPLTEDIQPGDIFLVQLPIDRQQEIYRTKGYLPLDNHLARINPDGYGSFYARSFGLVSKDVPKGLLDTGGDRKKAWSGAPAAAFPTYSFAVKKGKGLNLAIPLQGVPVGLSLMQSSEAVGSVSIRNARTIGVDIFSLHDQLVDTWWPDNRQRLAKYAPIRADGASQVRQRNYLRVITRVYLTGEVDISLRDMTALAAGADVAAPKPTELLLSSATKTGAAEITIDDYEKNLRRWNKALSRAGGARAAACASRRPPRGRSAQGRRLVPPLTIGYLGFDAILEGGCSDRQLDATPCCRSSPRLRADRAISLSDGTAVRRCDGRGERARGPGQGGIPGRSRPPRSGLVCLYDRRVGAGSDFGKLAIWRSRVLDPE
jgi:hypothetical protein